jgi:hypothetical protein
MYKFLKINKLHIDITQQLQFSMENLQYLSFHDAKLQIYQEIYKSFFSAKKFNISLIKQVVEPLF